MKRVFALALVLVMALSMMLLSASAYTLSCPEHDCYFECDDHEAHFYINNINGNDVDCCVFIGESIYMHPTSPVSVLNEGGIAQPAKGMVLYEDGSNFAICKMLDSPAQPKTGVMDTLPIWFAVCAVSACAYVLTSKKKVF